MNKDICITDNDINSTEQRLLPEGYTFSDEARNAIKELRSKSIVACPGSGKTTMLLSKLLILTKQLPLENNKGVCVLSHTNVAVNEIKDKVSDVGVTLKQYPNYIGTIQGFIHKYIVFPYVSSVYHIKPRILDNKQYDDLFYEMYSQLRSIWSLRGSVTNHVNKSKRVISEKDFLCSLYIDFEDQEKLKFQNNNLGGKQTKSNMQFRKLKETMWKRGLLSYSDAYDLTQIALEHNGEFLSKVISKRFQYVFIDEYQDCSAIQNKIIDMLFSHMAINLQKIGDPDQAIYSSYIEDETQWDYNNNYLAINGSRRYGDKIAYVISGLRFDKTQIETHSSSIDLKPHLIVFDNQSIRNVIPKFAEIIECYSLHRKSKTLFKAVGMIRNGSGLKIFDYLDNNIVAKDYIDKQTLVDYLLELSNSISLGSVRILLTILYKILSIVVSNYSNEDLSSSKIEKNIKSSDYIDDFNKSVIKIINIPIYDDFLEYIKAMAYIVKSEIYHLANIIFDIEIDENDDFNKIIFDNIEQNSTIDNQNFNKYYHTTTDGEKISIEVSTVHQVKGETHTATLYMETEYKRGSDLKRVLPLMGGKKLADTMTHKKSRKIVYVGFSRPSDLLCVAIKRDTFEKFTSFFDDKWVIIKV